jgi:serine O-acetyltransferase
MSGPARPSLWKQLRKVYDTYEFNSLQSKPPEKPFREHWEAKGERTALFFLGMPLAPIALLRVRDWLLQRNVPLLPYFCDVVSNAVWDVSIGRKVEAGPGLYIPHGHVVIDGLVRIGRDCSVNPWVTVGMSASRRWGFDKRGPNIGNDVYIGTGAKVLGPITIGDGARIGANSVVIDDVPAGATVVGAPARVVHERQADWVTHPESYSGFVRKKGVGDE